MKHRNEKSKTKYRNQRKQFKNQKSEFLSDPSNVRVKYNQLLTSNWLEDI